MSDSDVLLIDKPIEYVQRITLNRPDRRNALSNEMRGELIETLDGPFPAGDEELYTVEEQDTPSPAIGVVGVIEGRRVFARYCQLDPRHETQKQERPFARLVRFGCAKTLDAEEHADQERRVERVDLGDHALRPEALRERECESGDDRA